MTRRTVLEILQEPARAAEDLKHSKERLEQISAACQSITARYGGTGGGHSSGAGSSDGLSVLADAVSQVRKDTETLIRREKEARDLLDTLRREHDTFMERDYQLLRIRYILRLPWSSVQRALLQRGFPSAALRTVYGWHRRALDNAQDCMKEDI